MPDQTHMTRTADAAESRELVPRRSWGNWALLATTFVLTTLGFSIVIATMLPERLSNPWPWVRTDYALVAACLLLVVTFVVYLTSEQRHANRVHSQMLHFQEEVHESARRRLYALFDVSRAMGLESEPQAVFDRITRSCVDFFNCDQASLMLFDEQEQTLEVRSASGHQNVARVLGQKQKVGDGIAGWAALHKKPLVIGREDSLAENPELKLARKHLCAAIVVPIILRDELVGVVNISSRSTDVEYTDDDMRALKVFAENAGTCIRNMERVQWMRTTIDGLRAQLTRAGAAPATSGRLNESVDT